MVLASQIFRQIIGDLIGVDADGLANILERIHDLCKCRLHNFLIGKK